MVKITNKEIIDVVQYSNDKAIFVEKNPIGDFTQYKISYFVLNFKTGKKEVITKSAYLLKKFGAMFKIISETVESYEQSDSMILPSRNVLLVFPNGQAGLFDNNGNIRKNDTLSYNGSVVSSAAADGEYFWSCCKDENCVIRYNADNLQVDLRIGGKDAQTFSKPEFASADDNYIYVCCEGSKVRKIDKQNFTVSDVNGSYDGLKRFYKHNNFSIICTYNGAYIDKD